MGRKKKKNVVRCDVCGLTATRQLATDVHVCNNVVCEQLVLESMAQTVRQAKEQEKKGEQ